MVVHLIEVENGSGVIVGEWKGDTARMTAPVAPDGRAFVDVTAEGHALGALSGSGYRYVDGALVAPAPRLPVIEKATFALLFTRAQRDAIRAHRRANPDDDDVEDLSWFLDRIDRIDLNVPAVAAMLSGGLSLLVSKGLLTPQEAARIAAGTPPA